MTEEIEIAQEPVSQEAAIPEVVETTEVKQEASKESAGNAADINWQRANEVLKLQKQKIEELEQRLSQKADVVQQEEPDEFANLDPDDYLTVSKARNLAEKLAEKKAAQTAKQVVQEYIQQQQVVTDETRMRSKYEDYDYVVENYAIPLIKNDPALAYKIQQSKNPAETAYRLGKLSDQYEESNMKQQTSPKAEKVLKNTSRPLSSAAAGSPLKNQADQFSKMSPAEIWAQSQKYAKGA